MSHAEVQGLRMYHEWRAAAEGAVPLVLLHGALEAGTAFEGLVAALPASWPVLVVDLQAHGRTADIDRPMRLETLADDVAALLAHLAIPRADVLGYSMGGGVAARLALQHPSLLRSLMVLSFPFRSAARHADVQAGLNAWGPHLAEALLDSPPHQLYTRLAPHPEAWPRLVQRVGEAMGGDFDWTADVGALTGPVLLVCGDADQFPPAHAAECFALLGGGLRDGGWNGAGSAPHQLAVLPGTTHHTLLTSPLLPPIVTAFRTAVSRA